MTAEYYLMFIVSRCNVLKGVQKSGETVDAIYFHKKYEDATLRLQFDDYVECWDELEDSIRFQLNNKLHGYLNENTVIELTNSVLDSWLSKEKPYYETLIRSKFLDMFKLPQYTSKTVLHKQFFEIDEKCLCVDISGTLRVDRKRMFRKGQINFDGKCRIIEVSKDDIVKMASS